MSVAIPILIMISLANVQCASYPINRNKQMLMLRCKYFLPMICPLCRCISASKSLLLARIYVISVLMLFQQMIFGILKKLIMALLVADKGMTGILEYPYASSFFTRV